MRIRFHSVGGYGTIATGKLLTDILAGVLGMHSKSAPKYGSEKSGAPTNYYITLSPEPVLITNAELEDVEVVISPDHKAFIHTNPLKGLVEGGTFILQSDLVARGGLARAAPVRPADHPRAAHPLPRRRRLHRGQEARPDPRARDPHDGHRVHRRRRRPRRPGVRRAPPQEAILAKVRAQIVKKFGGKGDAVVEGNMAVIREGIEATQVVDYDTPEFLAIDDAPPGAVAALASRLVGIDVRQLRRARQRPVRPRVLRGPHRAAVPRGHDRRGAGAARRRPVHAGRHGGRQGQGPVPAHRAGVPRRPVHRLHGVRPGLPGRRDPEHRARDPRPAAHRHQGRSTSPSPSARRCAARCTRWPSRSASPTAQDKTDRAFPEVVAGAVADPRRRPALAAAQPRPARRPPSRSTRWPARGRSSTRWRRPSPAPAGCSPRPSTRGSAPAAWSASRSAARAP